MPHNTSHHLAANHHRRGLTLVELVVSMSALALVLGQVVPAAKDARSASLRTACQDKLGRIAAAGLIYAAEDPNELAIPISKGDAYITQPYSAMYGFGGKSGLGPFNDVRNSPLGGILDLGAMHRPLNAILFKEPFGLPPLRQGSRGAAFLDWDRDARLDLDAYHCPADNGFPGMHYMGWKNSGLSGYDYFGTSYSANAFFIGSIGGGSALQSNSAYSRPTSRIPNPQATILYWEAAARFAMFATNPDLDQAGYCWPWFMDQFTPAYGWHGTPFHFVTARTDGHVTWTQVKGYGRHTPLPVLPPGYTDPGVTCIVVRAPGWQLDTFPAPPLVTQKIRDGNNGTLISTQDGSSGNIWDIAAQ